jgi:LmbE family N-acetylglucosaminyl deacetylase
MATIVSFHAHPDDESIATGGTLARAADEGHRVVLVFATRGELGEVPEGFLADGEELWSRREQETAESARVLGAHRVEFLGYRDSGMQDEPTNGDPGCFWQADPDAAAERLAGLLREESADVLTVYDDHGTYGHPDHVQVHRVGVRAAELAGTAHVLESTFNRDAIRRMMDETAAEDAPSGEAPPDPPDVEPDTFGTPEAEITTVIDVTPWIARKRASMAAHASQIPPESFFLDMTEERFVRAFGTEWFIRRGPAVDGVDDWLLPPASRQDGPGSRTRQT